jgi:ubiquinone biosynthesis protein
MTRPYAREFMRRRFSPGSIYERSSTELQNYFNAFREFPFQVQEILDQTRKGGVKINFVHQNLEDVIQRATVMTNRLVVAIVLASLILGSSIIGVLLEGGPQLMGVSLFALFGFLISAFFGLWLVVGIMRSGKR